MKYWVLISLLHFSVMLLLHEAQGLRLIKGTPAAVQHDIREMIHGGRSINDGDEAGTLRKGEPCSGRIRKLNMSPISSTSTMAKTGIKSHTKSEVPSAQNEIERKEEKFSIHPSSSAMQQQRAPSYLGILDIAGMDYSQARRKPPIHN